MSNSEEKISIEVLKLNTRDGLVQNALSGLPEGTTPGFIRDLGYLLIESAAAMDGESTAIVEPTHQIEQDEAIQAEFDKLDAARKGHSDIREGVGRVRRTEACTRQTDLPLHRPGHTIHIPTRQPRNIHIEPTVDEMLEAHIDMPHMKPADAMFASEEGETPEPEIFNENTRLIVESFMARWRGISQAKHEEGYGRVGRFVAASKDALGYDREANDEIATIKAVEVDRVLQIATQMIANGQDVSKLTAKYPAVKDLGRFLRTMEYDAQPSKSEVYKDSSDHTIGGNVVAPSKPKVILDGEVLNWVEAEDALNDELVRITSDHSSDRADSGVK